MLDALDFAEELRMKQGDEASGGRACAGGVREVDLGRPEVRVAWASR
jgi:hypothetical protein